MVIFIAAWYPAYKYLKNQYSPPVIIFLPRAINDERVLHYDAVNTCRFVVAITGLHNLRILTRLPHFMDLNEAQLGNHKVYDDNENEDEDEGAEQAANLPIRERATRQLIVQELEAARARRHQEQ